VAEQTLSFAPEPSAGLDVWPRRMARNSLLP
jgi:hypothetical protein